MPKQLVVVPLGGWIVSMILGCTALPVARTNAMLDPCPNSPNCVCSLDSRSKHFIAPLVYEGPLYQARDRLVAIISSIKRATVPQVEDRYVFVSVRSRFLGFVDDLSFCFDPEHHLIHMRSAARTGYYDFGVNRKRLEQIRAVWEGR